MADVGLDGTYDPQNIFARILRGELPCHRVFEDEHALAFLDLFPQARGHTLVLPKAPARNLLDIDPDALGELGVRVQRVARGVRAALAPDGLTISQFNGAAGGQSVFHLHFHIIPRWEDQPLGGHGGGRADPEELASLAERIAARLA
jgi:histidine triad (HIT) family protein